MAAVTATTTERTIIGNKLMVLATIGAIADTNTYVTGLTLVESAMTQITDAAAAADALTVTAISGGTITFGVAGTISGAYVWFIGV